MGDWLMFCPGCGMEPRVPHERGCPGETCPYCWGLLAKCGCLAKLGLSEVPEERRINWVPFSGSSSPCTDEYGEDYCEDERFAPDE
jgi:hypothetical protein